MVLDCHFGSVRNHLLYYILKLPKVGLYHYCPLNIRIPSLLFANQGAGFFACVKSSANGKTHGCRAYLQSFAKHF